MNIFENAGMNKCIDHPEVLLEWDGHSWVCAQCILDKYTECWDGDLLDGRMDLGYDEDE